MTFCGLVMTDLVWQVYCGGETSGGTRQRLREHGEEWETQGGFMGAELTWPSMVLTEVLAEICL
jgi:hypothetical protein